MPVFRVHFRVLERLEYLVGQFSAGEDLPVAALEAAVFLGGDHDRPVVVVAGDDHGLGQRHILVAAGFLAEFSHGYTNNVDHGCLPNDQSYAISGGKANVLSRHNRLGLDLHLQGRQDQGRDADQGGGWAVFAEIALSGGVD